MWRILFGGRHDEARGSGWTSVDPEDARFQEQPVVEQARELQPSPHSYDGFPGQERVGVGPERDNQD